MVCHQPCVFLCLCRGFSKACRIPWDEAIGGIPHRHTHQVSQCRLYIHHTYIYIYILHNIYIYIYIPSYKSPFLSWCRGSHGFKATPIWKNTRIMSSAFRVFACASAQRAVKAACIGRIWRVLPCFPRRPSSVQQIV